MVLHGNGVKRYILTAIDDCTRFRVLRLYDQNIQQNAMDFVNQVREVLPFAVKQVQTDNGAEFGSTFTWHLADLGIEHRKTKERRRRTARSNALTRRTLRSSTNARSSAMSECSSSVFGKSCPCTNN